MKCIFVIHSLVNFQLLQFFGQLVQFILEFHFVHVSVVVIDLHDGIVDDSVVVVCDHFLFVLHDFDEDLIGGLNWSRELDVQMLVINFRLLSVFVVFVPFGKILTK